MRRRRAGIVSRNKVEQGADVKLEQRSGERDHHEFMNSVGSLNGRAFIRRARNIGRVRASLRAHRSVLTAKSGVLLPVRRE
ncbi:unnamed protein product [Pleuronectes platessa]|uniref:Uncharacterized protein n=1 Tax=Pleuronectes platessa TaxID=8262 RepID=A0A9N7U3F8_PLEPL|nr:unnamed protein product [Pleuronectes platessa]